MYKGDGQTRKFKFKKFKKKNRNLRGKGMCT